MSTRRKHLGCAVYNNLIYRYNLMMIANFTCRTHTINVVSLFYLFNFSVGGRDDCMELSSAERYNPLTNSWQVNLLQSILFYFRTVDKVLHF